MDITETLVPKSDQLNAEDLLTGPRTVTVEKVTKGSVEQPVDIHLAEFPGRPFRPSKTVRRILVAAWGVEATAYTGRRMTLYRDPAVRFGGQDVGGIRVSHLSHIDKPLTISLTETRGKRKPHRIEPLAEPPEAVAEFERRIRESRTLPELDTVAADLKACDLGARRDHLLTACRHRWHELKADDAPPDGEPQDPTVLRLAQIRKVEKLDDDEAWADYVQAACGSPIGKDGSLTAAQAAKIISIFDEDGAK
jgi:hypothetical protein